MRPDELFAAALLLLGPVLGAPAQQELIERGTFKGYKFRVDRALLSPDGKVLAAGGGDTRGGDLKLWDVTTGKEIVSLPGYTNSLYSLSFSADGKRLASGSYDTVQVWDMNAHQQLISFKVPGPGASVVALNRDGTRVAAVSWKQAHVWEVDSGKELNSFRHHVAISGMLGGAFRRDLAILASRNYQEIDLWDTATGKEKATLSEHRGEVGCMVWSADDKTLIASSHRYYGKDSKRKGDVKLWDVASGKERAALTGPFGLFLTMALTPDGKTLALVDSLELYAEADLKLVDVDTGRQRVIPVPPGCSFLSLHVTPENKLLITGTSDNAVRLWEVSLSKGDMKP
jgi:WD40 repeat protein